VLQVSAAEFINVNIMIVENGFTYKWKKKYFLIFRSIGQRFGVSKSAAWRCTMRVCHALLQVNQSHGIIKWPRENRMREIAADYERRSGIPGK
jgi:hypothetical protein